MMRLLGAAFCLSVVSVVSAETDIHAFDCRRLSNTCQNGGTCETTGTCTCTGTKQNYDCSDDSTTDAGSNTCGCVTGTCKNNGLCVCQETHYGAKCDQKTIQAKCGTAGKKILVNVNIPNIDNIEVHPLGKRDTCSLTPDSHEDIPGEWAGKSRAISVPTDVMCGDAAPKRSGKSAGYCIKLIIRHNKLIITTLDSLVTFCCVNAVLVSKTVGPVHVRSTTTTTTTTPGESLGVSILYQASYIVTIVSAFLAFVL